MEKREQLYAGKAKSIYKTDDPDHVRPDEDLALAEKRQGAHHRRSRARTARRGVAGLRPAPPVDVPRHRHSTFLCSWRCPRAIALLAFLLFPCLAFPSLTAVR